MATAKNNEKEKNAVAPAPEKDLEAENAALKAELEAENAALKAELEALKSNAAAPAEPAAPKMVKIKLPKSKDQKEDVFVSVNFRTYQIQRGVEVEVPDFVYEVLQHQEEMLEQIMLFEEKVQSKGGDK